MRSVTLLDLKNAVLDRYDLPAYASTGFVSTTGITRTINASLQAFYALLVECYGSEYFDATATISTIAGVSVTSLPSRFYKLRSLVWIRGTDDIVPVPRINQEEVYLGAYDPQSWSTYAPRYAVQGQAVRWYPTPNAVYSLSMSYAALPDDLAEDTDAFDGGAGHEEWVVAEVCRRIALREDKDPSVFLYERDVVERRIRTQASERDEAEPMILRDVQSTNESAWARRNRLTRL